MNPTYTVLGYYFPGDNREKKKMTKDNYINFSTFDEVKAHLLSLTQKHNITINVEELKDNWGSQRFGGRITKEVFADYCVVVFKGFLISDITEALKNKEISFNTRGHNNVMFAKGEESSQKHFKEEFESRYNRIVEGAEKLPDNIFTLSKLYQPIGVGEILMESECYCWDCDARLQFVLVNEKTVSLIDGSYYYKLSDKFAENLKLTDLKLIPECPALPFLKTRKMVARIKVPTGKLIFQNHFGEDKIIRDAPKGEEYKSPGLNSLLGRNKIMQYLASQNVGYGQMGNMSVAVYSNGKDEIIIGDTYYEDMIFDREAAISGKYGEIDVERLEEYKTELKLYKNFKKLITEGGFKKKGEISLDVWRWMCADKQIYDAAKIKAYDHMDVVKVNVQKGEYEIEHYYDMAQESNPLYSRIKKIQD